MMMNKKALYLAVAASVGAMGASQASAAAATYGSELASGSSLAGATWAIPTTLYAPTTANPLYFNIALSNGASFSASPTMVCTSTAVAGGSGGNITTANIALAAGGAGTGNATFVVTAVTAGFMISSCTITNGSVVIGTWPGSVSESAVITYGNNLSPTASNSTALLAASSLFSNAATAATNTALVATGFISFSTAGTNTATTNTAKIGSFTITLNDNLLSTGNAANAQLKLTGVVTAITVSLAGSPLVAANSTTGGVFITYATATQGATGCGGTLLVSATGGSSAITFSAVAPGTNTMTGAVYSVCMGVSGAVIPAGTITVGVAGAGNTDPVNANTSAFQIGTLIASGTTLGTITHNGSSTTILNVPPTGSLGAGFIRIYNTSAAGSGAVTATVYNDAGTVLGTANGTLTASLAPNAVLALPVATLESTLGITPPASGRYKVVVNGAFSNMRAQSIANTGGILVNMSSDTSGNGID